MAFELPQLAYAHAALEPHIDTKTMEIHHGKHHQAYVTNLNAALTGTDAENLSIEEICKNISKYPMAVRNNGGGHYNHSLFWTIMAPNAGGSPKGDLATAIENDLGGFEKFKTDLKELLKLISIESLSFVEFEDLKQIEDFYDEYLKLQKKYNQ